MSFLSRLDAMMDNAKTEWHIFKFQPWNSSPDVSFWQKLSLLKLDKFQPDDQAQHLTGYFTPGRSTDVPARFTVDDSAFCSILDRRRQGLVPMAAATAVEPLGALLNAPEGKCVRATKPENASSPLHFVPHQVHEFLNAFEKGVVAGPAFDKCIACSPKVLSAYVADGFDLLARACNCTTYLDELTGLSELVDDANARMVDVEDSDEDGTLV
ncbi:hypothetical protein PsorP6_013161 [Peronosclerospora sorghi]|uniref:Uncharacterized protein n=1 Tax=Peronosclerospora sorghi TaxID=230839 RepID=A0ACC0WG75_9STRA|nr:hypothetical protein PsorP6_013161 [Peronosclerospora sorghi]